MAELSAEQEKMAVAMGLHLAAAISAAVAMAIETGEPLASVRASLLETCAELFDDFVAELPNG